MAKKIIPSELKTHLADQLVESVSEVANNYYYGFLGDHLTQAGTTTDVRTPSTNLKTLQVDSYRNMIFGKKLEPNDVRMMIRRIDWASNTVYDMYDDETLNIYEKDFYVVVDENAFKHVYKCLYNANNSPSVSKPIFSDVKYDADLFRNDDSYYETADGYQWKYMYSVDSTTFDKFSTDNFVPVVANTVIERDAVNGSIDMIKVVTHGKDYNNFLSGQFSENDIEVNGNTLVYQVANTSSKVEGFYGNTVLHLVSGTGSGQYANVVNSKFDTNVGLNGGIVLVLDTAFAVRPDATTRYDVSPRIQITGDGLQTVNAYAKAIINANASNSVHRVEILEPGENYNYATATVLKGVPADENNGSVGEPILPTDALLRPIMPPPGGHGANTIVELGASAFCMYVKFEKDEQGTVAVTNDFNQFGIIRDPKFSNVEVKHVRYDGVDGSDGTFTPDENVFQFKKIQVTGDVTVTAANNFILANESSEYVSYFNAGEYVFIRSNEDPAYHHFSRIDIVANNTALVMNTDPSWSSSNAELYAVKILSRSKVDRRDGSAKTFLYNCDSGLVLDQLMVGETSQAIANVVSININNRFDSTSANTEFTFDTFNQMLRVEGSYATGAEFIEDERVYQGSSIATANMTAYVHSANQTHLSLTNVTGRINTSADIIGEDSGATFTSITNKYDGDLDPTTGSVIYLQNDVSVLRNEQQSEEIRVIVEF